MGTSLLSVNAISVERGFRQLFSDVSFSLSEGQLLKVVGANGAGKSTLLKILSRQSKEYTGTIHYKGECLEKSPLFPAETCFLGHQSGIKKRLTPLENLQFFSALYPCKPDMSPLESLSMLGLRSFSDAFAGELSQGQQQRIAFARFLLSDAKLWLLDEPFTAIDVTGIQLIEGMMAGFLAGGGSIIMTSHHDVNIKDALTLTLGDKPRG